MVKGAPGITAVPLLRRYRQLTPRDKYNIVSLAYGTKPSKRLQMRKARVAKALSLDFHSVSRVIEKHKKYGYDKILTVTNLKGLHEQSPRTIHSKTYEAWLTDPDTLKKWSHLTLR